MSSTVQSTRRRARRSFTPRLTIRRFALDEPEVCVDQKDYLVRFRGPGRGVVLEYPGTRYTILPSPGVGGKLVCNCPAFAREPDRDCKHVGSLRSLYRLLGESLSLAPAVEPPRKG